MKTTTTWGIIYYNHTRSVNPINYLECISHGAGEDNKPQATHNVIETIHRMPRPCSSNLTQGEDTVKTQNNSVGHVFEDDYDIQ